MFLRKNVQMWMGPISGAPSLTSSSKLTLIWCPRKNPMCMFQEFMDSKFIRKKDPNITKTIRVHSTSLTMENTMPMGLIRTTLGPMPLRRKTDRTKLIANQMKNS